MKLRQSNWDCNDEIDHYAIKRGFEGRHKCKFLKDAVVNCQKVMRKISQAMIDPPGINPYKKVKMNEKYKEFTSIHLQDDVLYHPPTDSGKKIVKEEKGKCGDLRKSKKL